MRLSTRGRYGLRAMLDIAIDQSDEPVTLASISERQGVSIGYLEQLMVPLKKEGLIRSVRGAQGGYLLSRVPENITVGDIIRTLEGPIAPVACVSEDYPEECDRAEGCVTRLVWAKVRDSIAEVLDSLTLHDLIEETRKSSDR
ncbi:MAG: Rrf2 family transcriptional regulator [Syntrophaceticus sp.]|nr:Rrf2 family transcriptional regulator [Syntrophaceticus sp.]MDD3314458.1 Rrf2 family transcriptional regulator [Syntrophaceticus sp.]MDD4360153.1 Rrf2 family transcriptional regulator [Syntrophaceticus sp.]MDD4783149.1 Rrf2 family transcriptional regulator [Syntrophaceticus sp.]